MRIGIDASPAARKEKTGVEWYTHHLLFEFAKQDKENRYTLYTRTEFSKEDLKRLPKNFTEKVLSSPTKWFWPQLRLTPSLLFKRPDVLFIPADATPLIHPKKMVVTIHDIAFKVFPELYEFKRRTYLDISTRMALHQASEIITVSEFTKQELVKYYKADPNKIHVTHLGYDEKFYTPLKEDEFVPSAQVQQKYGLKKPYVLTISPLEKKKNLPTLISAFEKIKPNHPDIQLVIAGKARLSEREIHNQIARSPYKEDIKTLGWIPQEEKVLLLKNAYVFAFPSFYEGFGLPVIEAQSCHVPVIAANAGSLPEIGGDSVLFHDPHSSQELAEQLKKMIANTQLRESMIEKGKNNIKRFSWKKCAEKTLKIIKKNENRGQKK